jgi:hypothetical protein
MRRYPINVTLTRRDFLATAISTAGLVGCVVQPASATDTGDTSIHIGSRRELFIDGFLVEHLLGNAEQRLHHPIPREIALQHDEPWEGTGSGYHSLFQDGKKYRMYYKAWHLEADEGTLKTDRHPLYCCYAESDDGIRWRKPRLGLYEFEGSKQNNITMVSGPLGPLNVDAGHPAVFKDDNPIAPADARYKAIFRSQSPNGLLPFKSSDGLNWSPMTTEPILQGVGAFDSQNLAFWDPNIGQYRAYWRIFTAGVANDEVWQPAGNRAIRTATSHDLIHWGDHTDITFEDSPPEQLYTNQIKPYARAPHLLIGFPTRYIDRGWSESMRALPASEARQTRSSSTPRYGTALTDALLMVSRNGTKFTRWNEAFLRPGAERPDAWHYGHQYIGWHIVETASAVSGAPRELSLYASEGYWHGKGSAVRRYTLRLDGFVSIRASARGGQMITKRLSFTGSQLRLNFATSAAGSVRVEIQDSDAKALPGYSLDDCHPIFGDTTDRLVTWKSGPDVGGLSGKTVRLRFELKDADVYSLRFVNRPT